MDIILVLLFLLMVFTTHFNTIIVSVNVYVSVQHNQHYLHQS